MRDLTTIQLDEIRNGGWAKVERFEQAEALMKAINRREVSTTKRAIARQAIYPDTGWIVRYGDLRSRSQLLSVAQKIRRDHVADAAGLGLDALIGLLYSTSVPWDYTSYTDRMDIWTERLAYTAPEVANDRDKYLKAWETVEPLIRGSVEFVDEHPDVVHGYLAPQSSDTSNESIYAAQNEGIAQVRAEVEAEESFVKLVGKLAGSLLPWLPGQGPVEGTAANAKLQDFIGEFANQLTEDARVTFLGYVNAAATAAQLEREDALPDVTGVSEDDYLPGGCLS